ncbi:Protein ZBED8, partial [Frankliniella fusca]
WNYSGGVQVVTDEAKVTDLRFALFIAMHSAVKSIDHLGELLRGLSGKDGPFSKLRIHRTKCSKLISAVIAPAFLTDLVRDVGESPYSIIADEATDCSTSKFLGLCIKYYSINQEQMVTDFLGLAQVVGQRGAELADATKEYLRCCGLKLQNMIAVGTDGAANMCGAHNSFYTHLKADVPHLQILKCVCHSIDRCAENAHKAIPSDVDKIMHQTNNFFCHSTLRQANYADYYKTLNGGKEPAKIPRMVETRWLSWIPVVEYLVSHWTELKGFFNLQASHANKDEKTRLKAVSVAALYNSNTIYLYLLFLKNILRDLNQVNLAFQHTNADITKLHADLRNLLFSLAERIVKEQAIPNVDRAGVVRTVEVQALRQALNTSGNLLPLDQAKFGSSFKAAAATCNLSEPELRAVRNTCGRYIFQLCLELFDRLPGNIESVVKLRHFRPIVAFSRNARPQFNQLPLDLAKPGEDLDRLESQWISLVNTSLNDICPHALRNDDLKTMDIVHFWGCVLKCSNALGEHPFKELALFALRCLTIPISNAVVERIFSFLSAVKTKQRNRMQVLLLEALIRIRAHFKVKSLSLTLKLTFVIQTFCVN